MTDAAQAYALAGEPDRALDLLDEYVADGKCFRRLLENVPDFESLREMPWFQAIMACSHQGGSRPD